MTELEISINAILNHLKPQLANATWESRRHYFNQMLRCAKYLGITEPCEELYTVFIADDHGSPERRALHIRCVKIIDKLACTGARDENGILFNEPAMPQASEVLDYFEGQSYPIMTGVPLDYLLVKAELEIENLHLTSSTKGQYKHAWMDIRRYCYAADHTEYDEILIQEFIQKISDLRNDGSIKEWKWKINRKAAYILIEVANTGTFQWNIITSKANLPNSEIETIRSQYLKSLTERNFSTSTIGLYDYVFRKAMVFLEIFSLQDVNRISVNSIHQAVIKFADICNKRSMATIIPIFRSILVYLHASGLMERNLSGAVMRVNVQRHSVAAYISKQDYDKLILQLENESKRVKAIMLLAMKLGLRTSDICNLIFDEIDWQQDQIRLKQQKTGEPLVLPLIPDIGNALMDYIMNERPKRDDAYPYVFLRKNAPHNKLNTVYFICSKLLEQQNIVPVNGSTRGLHLFRYSLVHRLLATKVPHQVITDVLGHSSKESDKPYLSMEASMLKMCALDLSVIGSISWKGGV